MTDRSAGGALVLRVMPRALAVAAAVLAALPVPGRTAELTLSVAVSLKDAVADLGPAFERQFPGTRLLVNLGGTGALARQIEAGAPADVFLAAALEPVEALERGGFLVPGTRRLFARNVLTVVEPAGSPLRLAEPEALLDPRVRRIAVGNPRTVPAGRYAEESLRALGLWERLRSRLVYGENARHVLEWVARGEVDAGWVYATDATARAGRVREAFRPPEDTYRTIVYPVAVVRDTHQPALATALVEALTGRDGATVLARHGFLLPRPTAR